MPFTSSQKRHYRRTKIRQEYRTIQNEQENLDQALNQDNINRAVSIVCNYPQFKTQLLLCCVQSVKMAQALADVGVPCNYWTLEGAETKACVDFIKNHSSIRG